MPGLKVMAAAGSSWPHDQNWALGRPPTFMTTGEFQLPPTHLSSPYQCPFGCLAHYLPVTECADEDGAEGENIGRSTVASQRWGSSFQRGPKTTDCVVLYWMVGEGNVSG